MSWSFLQPFLKGGKEWISKFVDTLKEYVLSAAEKFEELLDVAIKFLCEKLDSLCLEVAAGSMLDYKIDLPDWANGYLDDIAIQLPQSTLSFCLKDYLPDSIMNKCDPGRRLSSNDAKAPQKTLPANICYEGVRDSVNVSRMVDASYVWTSIPPPPSMRPGNATHKTYCFLADSVAMR